MDTTLTIIICIIIADFITGLIHWFEDTYGLPNWPILGKLVIEPNILHHQHPGWIGTMTTLISRNYQTVVLALIVSGIFVYFYGWIWPFILTIMLSSLGNEVHTWNHRGKNNFIIKFLQDTYLIQSARQHALHHKEPYDGYYCTLTNFTNVVLERVGFWRKMEWLILKSTGIQIKRMSIERSGV